MYSAIKQKFAAAVESGALVYTQSTQRPTLWNNVPVIYTLAPALGQKPTKSDNETSTKPKDPWNPPEEALLVEKLEKYSIVLNKFALAKYHFLIVTNEFVPQTSPLSESDWTVAMDTLRQANEQSGHRHVGFFNSGPHSGASIAHKHIQIMTLPENFKPFVDSVRPEEPQRGLQIGVSNDPNVPFAHFIAFLKDKSSDEIMMSYYELLARTFTVLASHQVERSFNVVFTEEWIMITPRKQEKVEGISINSLGTIGLILAKNDDQLARVEELGLNLVAELGFENEGRADYNAHIDTHTQY